jgi:hypothetical protein
MAYAGSAVDSAGHRERLASREVERALAEELNAAREAVRASDIRCRRTLESVPGGLSALDGSAPVHEARVERARAKEAFGAAQGRWLNFVIRGIVPDNPGVK